MVKECDHLFSEELNSSESIEKYEFLLGVRIVFVVILDTLLIDISL